MVRVLAVITFGPGCGGSLRSSAARAADAGVVPAASGACHRTAAAPAGGALEMPGAGA